MQWAKTPLYSKLMLFRWSPPTPLFQKQNSESPKKKKWWGGKKEKGVLFFFRSRLVKNIPLWPRKKKKNGERADKLNHNGGVPPLPLYQTIEEFGGFFCFQQPPNYKSVLRDHVWWFGNFKIWIFKRVGAIVPRKAQGPLTKKHLQEVFLLFSQLIP